MSIITHHDVHVQPELSNYTSEPSISNSVLLADMSTPDITSTASRQPNGPIPHDPLGVAMNNTGSLQQPIDGKEGTDSDTTLREPDDKGRSIRGFRWIIICVSIYLTCTLYGLDTTIAADVQGPVIADLGHVELLAWGELHQSPHSTFSFSHNPSRVLTDLRRQ